MKTWKKIEETKKKTGDILGLKRRNEERVRKVRIFLFTVTFYSRKTVQVKFLPINARFITYFGQLVFGSYLTKTK